MLPEIRKTLYGAKEDFSQSLVLPRQSEVKGGAFAKIPARITLRRSIELDLFESLILRLADHGQDDQRHPGTPSAPSGT